jgi:hypothetical protein
MQSQFECGKRYGSAWLFQGRVCRQGRDVRNRRNRFDDLIGLGSADSVATFL